jgi:hypothetical protein
MNMNSDTMRFILTKDLNLKDCAKVESQNLRNKQVMKEEKKFA